MKRIWTASLVAFSCCIWTAAQEPGWEWVRALHSADYEAATSVAGVPGTGDVLMAVEWKGTLGNILPVGVTESTDFTFTFGGQDGLVVKHDQAGNFLWAFKLGGSGDDQINDIHVDFKSNIYITGSVAAGLSNFTGRGSHSTDSVFFTSSTETSYLAKYNPDGYLLWVRFGVGSSWSEGRAVTSNQNDIYLAGNHQGTITFGGLPPYTANGGEDFFIVKYSLDGDEIWHLRGGSAEDDLVEDITCDDTRFYFTGSFRGGTLFLEDARANVTWINNASEGQAEIFVFQVSMNGDLEWEWTITSDFDDNGMGICMDTENVYVGGSIAGEAFFPLYAGNPVGHKGGEDGFICAISRTDGSTSWVRTLAGETDGDQEVLDISPDRDGNLYATGYYTSNLASTGEVRENKGMQDLFVASFTRDGAERWIKTAGSPGSDFGNGIDASIPGMVYLAGEYTDLISFDGDLKPADLGRNAFLAKLDLSCSDAIGGKLVIRDTAIFENESITLVLKDYRGDIQWEFSDPDMRNWNMLTADLRDSIEYTPGGTADYRAYVRSGNCRPDSSNVVRVVVSPRPPDFADAGENDTLCRGDSTQLMASGGESYKWEPTDSLDFPDIPNPWARPSVTTTYVVHVTTADGIIDSDTVTIYVLPRPRLQIMEDVSLCSGDEVVLSASGEGTFWWMPSTLVENPGLAETRATVDTTTTFRVILTGENGCRRVRAVTVFAIAPPRVYAGPDRVLDARFETSMQAILNSMETGYWTVLEGSGTFGDPGSPNSQVRDLQLGDNIFSWNVSNGFCPEVSDQVKITVNDFLIPTVITPNDDGKNDYFLVMGIENFPSSELVILNRWGEEVYREAPYYNNWRGMNSRGEELPEGTYFIILKIDATDVRKSYVMIIR